MISCLNYEDMSVVLVVPVCSNDPLLPDVAALARLICTSSACTDVAYVCNE